MADIATTPPKAPEVPKAPVEAPPETPLPEALPEPKPKEKYPLKSEISLRARELYEEAVPEEYRKARVKALMQIKPTRISREKLEAKALANQEEWGAASRRLMEEQGLPDEPASYEDIHRQIFTLGTRPPKDWGGYSKDQFTLVNSYAQKNLNKDYGSAEEATKKFGSDLLEHETSKAKARKQIKDSKTAYTLRGVSDGKEVASVDRSGTSLDKSYSELLPSSIEQTLYEMDLDLDVLKKSTQALREAPKDEASLRALIPDDAERKDFLQNATMAGAPGRAKDLYVPLYQETGGRRTSIHLGSLEKNLASYYMMEAAKREGKTVSEYQGDGLDSLREEAEKRAKADVSRATANTTSYTYHHDPTEAKRAFLEDEGILGTLGKIRPIRPLVALLLDPRESGATIQQHGEVVESLAEKGFAAELLSDTSVTRAIDYFLRLAPSEAVGSAFSLAHKEYIGEFGDKAAGRGPWIAKRMFSLWGSDELSSEIMNSMDGASPLLMQAGSVMAGEYGDKYPMLFNVAGGLSAFGLMMVEPDAFYFLPVAGKLGKGVGRGAKTLREITYGGNKYLSRSGDILMAELRIAKTPDQIIAAVERARAKAIAELGTDEGIDIAEQLSGLDTVQLKDMTQLGEGTALSKAKVDYVRWANKARERYDDLLKNVTDKAALKDPKSGIEYAERLQAVLDVAEADIKTRIAAYAVADARVALRTVQLATAKLVDKIQTSKKMDEGQWKKLKEQLSSYEVQKLATKNQVDLQQLLKDLKNATTAELPAIMRRISDLTTGTTRRSPKALIASIQRRLARAELRRATLNKADSKYLDNLTSGLGTAFKEFRANIKKFDTTEGQKVAKSLKEKTDEIGLTAAVLKKVAGESRPAGAPGTMVTEVDKVGPVLQKALLDAADTYGDALRRNAVALQGLGTAEGRAFFEEMMTLGKGGLSDVSKAKTSAQFQKRLEAIGQTTLSAEDFLKSAQVAQFSRAMWDSPSRTLSRKSRVDVKNIPMWNLIQKAPFWMAYSEARIKVFMKRFPLLSRSARAIPIPVSNEVDQAVKGLTRRISLWVKGMDEVVLHANSGQEATDNIIAMLTTNDMMEIPSKFGVARGATIEPRGSGDKTLVRLLYEQLKGRAIAKQHNTEIETDYFFDGFLKSLVKNPDINMEDLRAVFLDIIGGDELLDQMSDKDLLETLQLRLKKAIGDVGGTLDGSARGQMLFYRNVVKGASQQLYNGRLANIMVFRVNEIDIAHSMNAFMEEGKAGQKAYQGRPRVGEFVVSRRVIETWHKVTSLEISGGRGKQAYDKSEIMSEAKALRVRRASTTEVRGTRPRDRPKGEDTKVEFRREHGIEQQLFDAGFGSPARRILKTEMRGGDEYAIFADGSAEKLADLSVLPPRLGLLNAYDGMLRWGIDLAGDIGRSEALTGVLGENRATYCKLVAMSVDAAGNPIMVPKGAIVEFTNGLQKIDKEFDNLRAATQYEDQLTMSLFDRTKAGIQWWRMKAVYGLLIPKPAHFMNNVISDWAQMALNPHIGFKAATQLSLFGAVGYMPYGREFQQLWMNFAKSRGGKGILLPPMLGALMNPALDDFFHGSTRVVRLKDGTTKTAGELWDEALEAGANENLRGYDRQDMIHRWVDQNVHTVAPAYIARGVANLADIKGGFFGIMSAVADDAARKQRGLLFFHCRVNLGMTFEQSRDVLAESLYDWSFSISQAERAILGSISAFYVFTKNAFGQTFSRLFDDTDLATREYTKKWLKVQTTQQKLKAMTRFSNQLLGQDQYVDPSKDISSEDRIGLAKQTRVPDWLKDYSLYNFGTLNPEARAIGEAAGVNKTNIVRTIPKITGVEFSSEYAHLGNVILGVLLAAVSSKVSVDQEKTAAKMIDTLLDSLNPYSADIMEKWIEGHTGRTPESEYGSPLKMDEFEMLSYMGFGTEIIADNKKDIFRASGSALPLVRMFASEERRARMFFTVLFPDTPLTPTSIKMLAAQGYNPRLEALAQLSGVGKVYFYNADLEQHFRMGDIKNELKAEGRFAEKVSRGPLNHQ